MSLWAIVPVKPLRRGKSRLSGVLTEEERTILNHTMLANTLKVLTSVPEIDQVLVISRDTAALALARDFEARTVQEDGRSDLNTALQRATYVAQRFAAKGVLVLPADLPMLNRDAVQCLVYASGYSPSVTIAPDRRQEGTNALLVTPPGVIDYQFGPGSLHRHIQQARQYGARLQILDIPELALDMDLPEDLELLRQNDAVQIGV